VDALESYAVPRIRRPLLALIVLVVAVAIGYGVNAIGSDNGPGSGPTTHTTTAQATTQATTHASGLTALSSLPTQVQDTVALIRRGGPYPYPRNDGVVFHNNEHLLPSKKDGYYHEYTVTTPGSPDRGTRRIITGSQGEYYYTGDHYEHFDKIDITR
jgi:ribonuclease T1